MFIAALAVFQALRGTNPFERRYAMVAQRRESLRAVALEPRRGRQRMSTAGLMNEVVTRLNLLRIAATPTTRACCWPRPACARTR